MLDLSGYVTDASFSADGTLRRVLSGVWKSVVCSEELVLRNYILIIQDH